MDCPMCSRLRAAYRRLSERNDVVFDAMLAGGSFALFGANVPVWFQSLFFKFTGAKESVYIFPDAFNVVLALFDPGDRFSDRVFLAL